jgi:hypothetical protein
LMLLDIKKLKTSRYERYIAPYLRQQAVWKCIKPWYIFQPIFNLFLLKYR